MINRKWVERNQVFIYLVIIIFGLTAVKLKYGYRGGNEVKEQVVITPTSTPEPTMVVKDEYPLEKELPYYGDGFVVEKYIAPMTLRMVVNGAELNDATDEVTIWINSFGDAIGQHKVEVGTMETPTPTTDVE